MTDRLKRILYALSALMGAYVLFLILLAGLAYYWWCESIYDWANYHDWLSGILFLVFDVVLLTGLVPSLVLHRLGFRGRAAFIASGVWAGLFTSYCLFYMLGIWDSGGPLMRVVLDNTSKGWHYATPAFVDAVFDTFRTIQSYIADAVSAVTTDGVNLAIVLNIAIGIALMCAIGALFGGIYWQTRVHKLSQAE